MYLVMQGVVQLAVVSAGVPGAFFDAMDVSSMEGGFKTDTGKHKEHRTGKRLDDFSWIKGSEGTLDLNIDDLNKKNLAFIFQGTSTDVASGSVTNEVIASSLPAVGDILRLSKPNVSAVVVRDSTGSPKTLTAGTNFTLDPTFGDVTIKDITTGGVFVAPIKADFSYGAHSNVVLMNQIGKEYWVRFKGVNADGANVLVEYYRWKPDPGDKLALITEDVTPSKVRGSLLADLTKTADAYLGQFGRVVML